MIKKNKRKNEDEAKNKKQKIDVVYDQEFEITWSDIQHRLEMIENTIKNDGKSNPLNFKDFSKVYR